MWKKYQTDDGRHYYYNKESKDTQWFPPAEACVYNLSVDEIQPIINKCNAQQARWESFVNAESLIVSLQANIRGCVSSMLTQIFRYE